MSRLRGWLESRLRTTCPESCRRRNLPPPDIQKAVTNSHFYRLPPELRSGILRLTFGDRILHLDLLPPSTWEADGDGLEEPPLCNFEPHQLRWWGCVCPRDRGDNPALDWCRTRWGLPSRVFTSRPDEINVGALGWFLSCRMGYLEGVEVLYSSNTIHLGSMEVISNMDVILPASHLARITSLELVCRLAILRGTMMRADEEWEWAQFDGILSKLPDVFPRLRNLNLCLNHGGGYEDSFGSADAMLEALEKVLNRVDSMVSAKARSVTVEIAVPAVLYYAVESDALKKGNTSEQVRAPWDRHFRREADLIGAYFVRCGADDLISSYG